MCMVEVFLNYESSSRTLSWRIGSWKKVKNALAKVSKVTWDPDFSSTYHLADGPVSVHWNNLNRMELFVMLFEENHKWKVMIWLEGLSPDFTSNLGMSEGSLVGIAGHVGLCNMGSLVSLVRSSMLREAKYGIWGGGIGLVPAIVWVFWVPDPWRGLGGFVLPPWEEVGPLLPCKGEKVNGWPWEVDPSKVETSKADPKIVVLIGVWDGGADELARLGTPPRIGGRFSKHLEWRGFCGSPMMSD